MIVDSVAAVVSPYIGGNQSDGQGLMAHLARALKSLAVDNGLAVLVSCEFFQI